MRMRATVAVVSGALALSALAAPVSQASSPSSALTGADASPVISKVVVNSGKPIVLGTTATKKVTVSVTASHSSGIEDALSYVWRGRDGKPNLYGFGFHPDAERAKCKVVNATTSTCTLTITVDPGYLWNTNATSWRVYAGAWGKDGSFTANDSYSSVRFQRLSRLTVKASPKPVKKGSTITVTGKLDRANWDTRKYAGYTSQSVKLQFRKKNSSTYTTVKTVKSSSTGTLKTTVKAAKDGYWRWSFAGTASTPAVNATGDFVHVK
ncbi:DUF5707 domain-containing protein [Streptomyces nodosus]|uniref:Calcium-binding protein n=1 Tax=Streptomyces nodosus TaxID=40318 RepID=A0A0B5DN93_9ACTN|nr:DUF5707 domain-containing protein [Streptomyces nodosus]AJE41467.1 sarcoplasmic reticulum histidine-rich calcium-binding protein [Streptomyces nodosus]QEV40007.1 calcium-binding protein [Streptomyces nodosus]